MRDRVSSRHEQSPLAEILELPVAERVKLNSGDLGQRLGAAGALPAVRGGAGEDRPPPGGVPPRSGIRFALARGEGTDPRPGVTRYAQLTREAETDLAGAFDYYEAQPSGLGRCAGFIRPQRPPPRRYCTAQS